MARFTKPLSRTGKPGDLPVAGWQAMAQSRLAAAAVLAAHAAPRPQEAVYLAGFALELALKGKGLQEGVAVDPIHDLEELLVRSQALRPARTTVVSPATATALGFSPGATYWQLFDLVRSQWHNEVRYGGGKTMPHEAKTFVAIVQELEGWLWSA